MNLFKRVLYAVLVAYKWDRAADEAAKRNYRSALNAIRDAEQIEGIRVAPEFLLLKAVVARNLKDPELALESAIQAYKQLEVDKRVSRGERPYLRCFASMLGLRIIDENGWVGRHNDFVVAYDLVDLDRVRKTTKQTFPLRGHPKWATDAK
jgi:hypothetical protein